MILPTVIIILQNNNKHRRIFFPAAVQIAFDYFSGIFVFFNISFVFVRRKQFFDVAIDWRIQITLSFNLNAWET